MTSWLTVDEFIAAAGISRRTFFRRSSTIQSRIVDGVKRYSAAALTPEQRAKLDGQQANSNERASITKADALAPLFAGVAAPAAVQTPARIALTPEAQKQASERLAIIQPLLDYVADPSTRTRFAQLKLKDGRSITTADLLSFYLGELHGVGSRTIWNWKKRFENGGVNALARNVRADKGKSKFFTKFPAAATLVASIYLRPYATVSRAYDNLLRDHQLLGIAAHELPSYETVRSYIETLPPSITVLARKGERAYKERMSPFVQRSYEDIPVNAYWVADHQIHDVECRNDCFEGVPENAPMRLRFSAFLDMRSRKFVGYCFAPEGNSRVITTALRRGIERYGPPVTIYCDNGKDYQKVAKGARSVTQEWVEEEYQALSRTGVLQRLGISVAFCLPYHPQSKLIESAFRTVHLKFDALFPHYTTGSAYLRPDQTTLAMAQHRKLLKMDRGSESPLVPASHFIRMCTVWLEEDYNAGHAHSGRGMDGRTPDQVFHELYPPTARRLADPRILAQLLWENQKRRVRECAITLNNRRYVAANPESSATLHLANETEVLICYDPHDLDSAVIADLDGRPIAEVRAEVLLPHSAEAQPAIAASMQERRRLRNATVATVRQIHQNVALMGHKSDLERLHERALLPAAVGDSIVHRMKPEPSTPAPSAPRYSHDIAAEFLSEEA